jgi:hypothetical protein
MGCYLSYINVIFHNINYIYVIIEVNYDKYVILGIEMEHIFL